MKRIILLLLLALALTSCAAPHQFAGTPLSAPHPAPAQALQSADGPVSLLGFKGQYVFVYFGYTYCPDICPVTLMTLKHVREELADQGDRVQVIMVSVDPERDTPESLATYVGYFDDSFIGMTGEKAEIDALGEPFGVYYEKGEGSEATGYLINHSALVYLLDPDGNARVAYPHSVTTEEILTDLQYFFRTES